MPFKIVAAIDFGTAGTSVALAHVSKPDHIIGVPIGDEEEIRTGSKAQTSLLLCEPNTIEEGVEFGRNAFLKYQESKAETWDVIDADGGVDEKPKAKVFRYFEKFKMCLYGTSITKTPMIKDAEGHEISAHVVFTAGLAYLKNVALYWLRKSLSVTGALCEEEIQWVLTVPAIWSAGAKQVMREAAKAAGMADAPEQLLFAWESEVSGLYGRKHDPHFKHRAFDVGTIYAVIDAGAGTVDVAIHQVLENGTIGEVCPPRGSDSGSHYVNLEFVHLLKQVFGVSAMEVWAKKEPVAMHALMESFERCKLADRSRAYAASSFSSKMVFSRVQLPLEFLRDFAVEKALNDFNCFTSQDNLALDRNDLKLSHTLMLHLFKTVLDKTMVVLQSMPDLRRCKVAFVSGGFAGAPELLGALADKFPLLELVVPKKPSLAVVYGAVAFGLHKGVISERVSPYSYGFTTCQFFTAEHKRQGIEPVWIIHDGEKRSVCDNVFKKLITAGTTLKAGQVIRATPKALSDNQTYVEFPILQSPDPHVRFSTETGCKRVAMLRVQLAKKDGRSSRPLTVEFNPVCTELQITAADAISGSMQTVDIDFLVDEPVHSLDVM